jgi:lambda repressor-like predicted transcriptional regulator
MVSCQLYGLILISDFYIRAGKGLKFFIILMKSISPTQKDNILVLSSSGLSTRNIASKTGLSKATIARVIKKSTPNKENINVSCPSKLTPYDKWAIIHYFLTGETSNTIQTTLIIISIIPSTVSTQTVRNTLKAANLKAVTKKKKPLLSPTHGKKRLTFTLKHQHWIIEDWKRVIWSDGQKYV